VENQSMNGWMWLLDDRRTIWLRHQATEDPIVFYGLVDGRRRELRITSIAPNSVTGFLDEAQ